MTTVCVIDRPKTPPAGAGALTGAATAPPGLGTMAVERLATGAAGEVPQLDGLVSPKLVPPMSAFPVAPVWPKKPKVPIRRRTI